MSIKRCPRCQGRIQEEATGRPPRYCSDACRQADYRKRHRKLRGYMAVMSSSRTDGWATDPTFIAKLTKEFGGFDLDPCCTADTARGMYYFTTAEDGLAQRWFGRVYMNPPYGRPLPLWMKKARDSVLSGDAELVVCLIPARVDTRWWHDIVQDKEGVEVRFVRGRLKFGKCISPAPFACALVVFRNAKTTPGALRNGAGTVARAAINPPGWSPWRRALVLGLLTSCPTLPTPTWQCNDEFQDYEIELPPWARPGRHPLP